MTPNRGRCCSFERGSGSVLALTVLLIPFFVASSVVLLGRIAVVQHRASLAADLSALGAADILVGRAPGTPCVQAARLAAVNDATLTACTVEDNAVHVEVRMTSGMLSLVQSARAGTEAFTPTPSPVTAVLASAKMLALTRN